MSFQEQVIGNTNQLADVYPSRILLEPKIIDRIDPVVYNHTLIQSLIDEEQLAFFEENGYLFLESFFDQEQVESWKHEMRRLWNQRQYDPSPEVIREPDGNEIRSIFATHRNEGVFREISLHPGLQAIARQILGSDVYIHQSRINFKQGFTGKEFYWHSDFETWHVEDGMPRMRALSCSIALEDNHANNGPLMVIPGSHRQYVSCVGQTPDDNFKSSLRRQVYGVPDKDSLSMLAANGGIVAPTGKAGSVIIFDCNIMHGSNSNITPDPRSNLFTVYNSVHNKLTLPYSGINPRPSYIAERG